MELYEHEAKELFAEWDIPVPAGTLVDTVEAGRDAAADLGYPVVVKAQVRSGGRMKAGGIRIVKSQSEAEDALETIFGMEIGGETVDDILIEQYVDLDEELYAGIAIDRTARRPVIMVSAAGGIDIEITAAEEGIPRQHIDPAYGLWRYQIRNVLFEAGIEGEIADSIAKIVEALHGLFTKYDCLDIEVNPIGVVGDRVVAIDAVCNIDANAHFRLSAITDRFERETGDDRAARAAELGLEYVPLEGSIGVIGNGAGLVMATLDGIEAGDARAANFLDVGGGADATQIAGALELVHSDPSVESILVNIFGGITRCDAVATGINEAINQLGSIDVPIVVRLAGNNAAAGRDVLDTDHVIVEETLSAAIDRAIEQRAQSSHHQHDDSDSTDHTDGEGAAK